jgi:uncharacterized membrane protein
MKGALWRRALAGIAVAACLIAVLIFSIDEPVRDRSQFMQATSVLRNENIIEASVGIDCPVEEVFKYYRDFENLPSFLGDVMAVEQIGPEWTTRVTEERPNELIRYETVTSPRLTTYWEIYFAPGSKAGETQVREVMKPPLGRLGRAALSLIGKFPAEEVKANLHRLKQVMETGKVTDTSYSVRGKF